MKKIISVFLAVCMVLVMAGCQSEEKIVFDAKGYVRAVLDAKYQHQYKDYAKQIGLSEDEAKEQLESEFAASLKTQVEATGMAFNEEQLTKYVQMEADLREKVQYEVKEAVEDEEGNYTVEVVVTPIDGYSQYAQNFQTDLQNAVNGGAAEADYMNIFLQCFQSSIENATALEQKSLTLHVNYTEKDNTRIYAIPEEEVLNFDLLATGQTQ